MLVISLDIVPFIPKDDDQTIMNSRTLCLSLIGVLLYEPQCTRPDIVFAINLSTR